MKVLITLALLGVASCGRLDSTYLPPNQRPFTSGFGAAGVHSGSSVYSGAGASHYSGSGASYFSGSGAYSTSGAYSAGAQVPIIRFDQNNDGDGTYQYNYETGNGISAQEQGDARGDGTKAHGGFSYTAPDGQQIHLQYTADENGFQPQGSHLPTPPPIPEAIRKSIEQNLADEARGIIDDGSYRGHQNNAGQYRVPAAGAFGASHGHGQAQGYAGYHY